MQDVIEASITSSDPHTALKKIVESAAATADNKSDIMEASIAPAKKKTRQ
jgi:hypothetical protein